MVGPKGIGGGSKLPPITTQTEAPAKASQTAKTDSVAAPADKIVSAGEFAPRLLQAARARDVNEVKGLVMSWTQAQNDMTALQDGLLALSNFLRVFGSGESDPKLYADIMKLEPPADRPFDAGTLELKGSALDQLGAVLQSAAKGHLSGELDLRAGENQALRQLLIAGNMGLQTDALKVKMAGWNELTPQLKNATTSFELGIRKMPSDSDTKFWVVGGINKSLEWVKNLRVSPEAVEWMKGHDLFKNYPKEFFAYFSAPTDDQGRRMPGGLSPFEADIRKCKIEAIPDGEIYMGGPIMRVSGPPAAVEFLETNLMRLVTSWTTVATAAAQMTMGAGDKPVAYFGPRRAPGGEETTMAISDAAALGGMTVSSDLMAGFLGQTITGTMEHSIMLMLKTVFRHDPTDEMKQPAVRARAGELLKSTWAAAEPGMTPAQLDAKVEAQLDDVLAEAHIFKNYAFEYDRQKSVALVDTSHPNVGVSAALLAQEMLQKEHGPDTKLFAIRLDSGNLLAQGLQFRRVMNGQGAESLKILATDGLLPETVKFFEQIEKEIKKGQAAGELQPSFYALMKQCPPSAGEGEEVPEIIKQAELLIASGGLQDGQTIFAGYGAGEKIADSVSTVGRPGIVYKASQMTFTSESTGEPVTVNMGKIPSPSKATGPNRQLLAKVGSDGKLEQWVIASPSEKPGRGFQKLMRPVFEDGQIKTNTSQQKAVEYAASRRAALPDALLEGGTPQLGMTAQYKAEWLAVVAETDPSRVDEFKAYFDKMWPTVEV